MLVSRKIDHTKCWDCSCKNKHCIIILDFWFNEIEIVGFWAVAFPRYLLCYVPLIIFLYWLLFSWCLWAFTVKSRSRFLSLALANCISLWIYRFFYTRTSVYNKWKTESISRKQNSLINNHVCINFNLSKYIFYIIWSHYKTMFL